jgi:hypothetical protein
MAILEQEQQVQEALVLPPLLQELQLQGLVVAVAAQVAPELQVLQVVRVAAAQVKLATLTAMLELLIQAVAAVALVLPLEILAEQAALVLSSFECPTTSPLRSLRV